jgi:hypothetical protein
MCSNDFRTVTRPGPNARQVIARDVGDLPAPARAKLVRENVAKLYIPVPTRCNDRLGAPPRLTSRCEFPLFRPMPVGALPNRVCG